MQPDGVKEGDWVLIHMGFAMSILDEEEATSTLKFLERIEQAWTDEFEAVTKSSIE